MRRGAHRRGAILARLRTTTFGARHGVPCGPAIAAMTCRIDAVALRDEFLFILEDLNLRVRIADRVIGADRDGDSVAPSDSRGVRFRHVAH